jgi:glycosyltransferase involved in cell wall biosynthesis
MNESGKAESFMPQASVVIPTFNGATRKLADCLEALRNQKTTCCYEIIVVDDGSTDDTVRLVQSMTEIRLIAQEQQGPAAARNLGSHQARGEIVLFTDDDCIPQPDWLEAMLKPFADGSVAGVKGRYLSRQPELIAQFVQLEYEEKYDRLSRFSYIDLIDTYSAAFRRNLLIDSGGFSTQFRVPSVEDREFSWRLAQNGNRLVFQPAAQVWHIHPQTVSEYFWKKFKNGFYGIQLIKKYPGMAKGTSDTRFTQKLQLLLVIGMFFAVIKSICSKNSFFRWFSPLGALFLASTFPTAGRAFRRDKRLLLLLPIFLFIRAQAFGLGLFAGLIRGRWENHGCGDKEGTPPS